MLYGPRDPGCAGRSLHKKFITAAVCGTVHTVQYTYVACYIETSYIQAGDVSAIGTLLHLAQRERRERYHHTFRSTPLSIAMSNPITAFWKSGMQSQGARDEEMRLRVAEYVLIGPSMLLSCFLMYDTVAHHSISSFFVFLFLFCCL